MLSGGGAIWNVGASLSQPLFHGGALLAQRRAAKASYEAAVDQYRQTVLAAFQNVADSLAALEHDAQALQASSHAALSAQGAYDDAAARVRLGALPPSAARASELQYRNARLDEIRATGARFADTARLYQAMGTPPADGAARTDTAANAGAAAPSDAGNGGRRRARHSARHRAPAELTPPARHAPGARTARAPRRNLPLDLT
jgi:outer membrane protein TolC